MLVWCMTIKPITLPHIKIAGNSNKEFEALSLETELNKERTLAIRPSGQTKD